jgi:hypothetical protein
MNNVNEGFSFTKKDFCQKLERNSNKPNLGYNLANTRPKLNLYLKPSA